MVFKSSQRRDNQADKTRPQRDSYSWARNALSCSAPGHGRAGLLDQLVSPRQSRDSAGRAVKQATRRFQRSSAQADGRVACCECKTLLSALPCQNRWCRW